MASPLSIGVVALLNLSQPPPPLTVVSAASFAAGPLAPDSIASGFGRGFSTATLAANSNPPSTTLGGITVTVQDAAGVGRPAPLFLVSPGQVNFPGTCGHGAGNGDCHSRGRRTPVSATVTIAASAPALFTEGSTGIAAAYVTTVAADGTQTNAPVFTSQSGSIAPAPIDVGAPGQAYLVLFGTGFIAPPAKPKSGAERVLTGCVNEDGAGCTLARRSHAGDRHLESRGPDDRMFTRSMGHEVGVKEPNLPARSCASAGATRSVWAAVGCRREPGERLRRWRRRLVNQVATAPVDHDLLSPCGQSGQIGLDRSTRCIFRCHGRVFRTEH